MEKHNQSGFLIVASQEDFRIQLDEDDREHIHRYKGISRVVPYCWQDCTADEKAEREILDVWLDVDSKYKGINCLVPTLDLAVELFNMFSAKSSREFEVIYCEKVEDCPEPLNEPIPVNLEFLGYDVASESGLEFYSVILDALPTKAEEIVKIFFRHLNANRLFPIREIAQIYRDTYLNLQLPDWNSQLAVWKISKVLW